MNYGIVRFTLGRILCITALLMAPSLFVALIYSEGWQGLWPFLLSILITGGFGLIMGFKRPENTSYFAREGFVIVALSWLALSVFGCLPFLFSGTIVNPVNAFFETASGFTTTGASIMTDVESTSKSILWWRSFTHLIGGMGVLVFALAVMPNIKSEDVYAMKAEVPGPTFGKIRAKLRSSARILYIIYLSMTAAVVILLFLGGMPLFDSFLHAFGTAGTGGFGIKANSVAYYNSAYIEYVIGVGMLLFGVNFNLYYFMIFKHIKGVLKNEELRWYLGIIAFAIISICINISHLYDSVSKMVRDVFFSVSSIITTTGYSTADFNRWPLFSKVCLLLLMFVGGMAGSTAGGLKVSRFAIYIKSAIQEIRKNVSPNRRLPVKFEGKTLNSGLLRQLSFYLTTYTIVFMILLLITTLSSQTFFTAFSAVAATFNNIGPGFDAVGPSGSYEGFDNLTTFILSIGMIMGRLEIFPVLVLLNPRTWKRG
ncbi:MAG: TrkH family potassium uptake protein [Oscillospiraceae bacterium]|nr:TrkH family potassium uptake protein [Oscillospiraceae bacterium]